MDQEQQQKQQEVSYTRGTPDPHCSNEHQTNEITTKRYEKNKKKIKQKHRAQRKKHAPTIQFT